MMGTVLSLVDLAGEGDASFFTIIDPVAGNSCDSNNCGSSDSRGC
jgi:hypothetical protein